MQIFDLSIRGIRPAVAHLVHGKRGDFYAIQHGEAGRRRWQYRIPLAAKEFPAQDEKNELPLEGIEFHLHPLGKRDAHDNPLYLLLPAHHPDGRQLILWHLDPGFRGFADYEVQGDARIVAAGHEAQGAAGRMGGADCPVVIVSGPCELRWSRFGRLYGQPGEWVARFDGETWMVASDEDALIEDAAFDTPIENQG